MTPTGVRILGESGLNAADGGRSLAPAAHVIETTRFRGCRAIPGRWLVPDWPEGQMEPTSLNRTMSSMVF